MREESHRSAAETVIDWRSLLTMPWWQLSGTRHGSTAPADGGSEDREDSPELDGVASLDRLLHASLGRLTLGISPAALTLAYTDWFAHLSLSPGKQQQLMQKAMRKWARLALYAIRSTLDAEHPPCIKPLPQDRRFSHASWGTWPFNLIYQSFLLQQQWWHNATTGVYGVSRHHENVVAFLTRQLIDMMSPANFIPTNPELLDTSLHQGGANLLTGAMNALEDWERVIAGRAPVGSERFQLGRDLAATPGKVVFRNRLIELIQYTPTTGKVAREPILIVPAWIMKYYILDLSPHNSLVRFLVERGHTVFMISWWNPTAQDRDLGLDDYRRLGIEASLNEIQGIVPNTRINLVGYCLGGTIAAIATAVRARRNDDLLNSLTMLAAQTDFREPGELSLFIDDAELSFLEDIMWEQGYLDTKQMAGAFQMLRTNDLVWSRLVREHLLGQREQVTDLMAWNSDATRMPYRMHSEYLRHLFLNNELSDGRYDVEGRPVALTDIRVPIFSVGTEKDHVAPWRSVYKIHLLTDTPVNFVLTTGGHNAGIISEPDHPRRSFRASHRGAEDVYLDADNWYQSAAVHQGSWWPYWTDWLAEHSSGRTAPPAMGAAERGHPLPEDAPGSYVRQR